MFAATGVAMAVFCAVSDSGWNNIDALGGDAEQERNDSLYRKRAITSAPSPVWNSCASARPDSVPVPFLFRLPSRFPFLFRFPFGFLFFPAQQLCAKLYGASDTAAQKPPKLWPRNSPRVVDFATENYSAL